MQLPQNKMQTREYMIYHLMYTADYIKKKKSIFFLLLLATQRHNSILNVCNTTLFKAEYSGKVWCLGVVVYAVESCEKSTWLLLNK